MNRDDHSVVMLLLDRLSKVFLLQLRKFEFQRNFRISKRHVRDLKQWYKYIKSMDLKLNFFVEQPYFCMCRKWAYSVLP